MEEECILLFQRISFYQRWWRKGELGLAIILDQEMARRVVSFEQEHGNRLLKIKIETKPKKSMIFQVYRPKKTMINKRWKKFYERYSNSVNNSLSYPGADIGSDHTREKMGV